MERLRNVESVKVKAWHGATFTSTLWCEDIMNTKPFGLIRMLEKNRFASKRLGTPMIHRLWHSKKKLMVIFHLLAMSLEEYYPAALFSFRGVVVSSA